MELLINASFTDHHVLAGNSLSGFSSPTSTRRGSDRKVGSQLPEKGEIVEEGGGGGGGDGIVHVAVGKSVEKTVALLQWTMRRFPNSEICLLHVHQPSPVIPTLLGNLPVIHANSQVVSAYRKEEWKNTRKLLGIYLSIFCRTKVKVTINTCEADQVKKGIVDMVNKNCIRKLVMGAGPEICMKGKKGSSKAYYAAKIAPPFCEIWFIDKGKHVWTREASGGPSSISSCSREETTTAENIRSKSLQHHKNKLLIRPECFQSSSGNGVTLTGIDNWVQGEPIDKEVSSSTILLSSTNRCISQYLQSPYSPTSSSSSSGCNSAERRLSSDSDLKVEEENLYSKVAQARAEANSSRDQAFAELLRCRKSEAKALEAISKVKLFESAHARESDLREEAQNALRTATKELEKLYKGREDIIKEKQKTMISVALLESRAKEANRRHDEAARELKLVRASVTTLLQEKHTIRQQKMESVRWLEQWRSRGQAGPENFYGYCGFVGDLPLLAEFSLEDLKTATCSFSESFEIGQGGYSCVYKGEMLGRTVAIKMLHPHNLQDQSEFQKEVKVLGRLHHPHLVTLLGACPEAWSLVYEYLPNGSLQEHLFRKSNTSLLAWKIRTRIVYEISSALCFLHSSRPEKIVHGDLKPENILLDSELSSKICEFGICRLVSKQTLRCPSFRQITEQKGAFMYTDPEFNRTGVLTPKSDIYSFGLIILQLLTGRTAIGLASVVSMAVSCGKLTSVLDSSAGEWPTFVASHLADLGLQCCQLKGKDRPDLKPSLVRELKQLCAPDERPVPSFFLCPILQEIMHDPQVAADGFTYEGDAIHGWLENGRKTSPMTNLELSHLHLIPNHALWHAIQEWICKS